MRKSIIQWNCHGYRARYPDIRGLLQEYQPLCVFLQETMLGDTNPASPQGYSIQTFSPGPNPVPGTGLAFLVKNTVGFQPLPINSPLQAMALRVGIGQALLTICNIYVSPQEDLNYQELSDLISQLPRPFLVGGDLNSWHTMWGCESCNRRGRVIEQLLENTDTCLLNNGRATHFHVQTGDSSAIDLSLCSPDILTDLAWTTADDLYGSDHYPILVDVLSCQPQMCEPRLLLRRADWKTFEALTQIQDFDENLSVDDMESSLTDNLRIAASIAIPSSSGGVTKHRVPWYTDECEVAKILRKTALRRYQRTRSEVDKIAYKRARARAQFVQLAAKRQSWSQYVSSINKDTPIGKVYKRIGKMKGKQQQHRSPCLTVGDLTTADSAVVADLLAEKFADTSSGRLYPPRFLAIKEAQERQRIDFTEIQQQPYNEEISMTEIWQALSKSKNSAPGPDGIHYQMLKRMHPTAVAAMLSLFNKVWNTHQFPVKWRTTTVLAFLKPGKPPSEPASYRPITLSSCVGKLLEKIVNGRLMRHLESENYIAPEQYGFRRHRGTTDALIRLQNETLKARENGAHTVCVFFDMHKAYDTTWRYGILRALHDMDIRGNLALYCEQFLTERYFRVKNGNVLSRVMAQVEGVPQGSVISCTLFIVALNGIVSNLPRDVQASIYVDDLMLYASSHYLPALTRRMQAAIGGVADWATTHGFVFSPQKTVALHVRPGRARVAAPLLTLNNAPIDFVTETKFLGMIIDEKITWKPHLRALKTSCTRKLDILKCLSKLSWGADREMLLMIYRSLIRSKIDYGCMVYQTATKANIAIIDPVHNAALRLCTGAFRSSPRVSLYAESGEPPLYLRRVQLSLQYLVRLKQLPHSPTWSSVCIPREDDAVFPYFMPSSIDYGALVTEVDLREFNVLPAQWNAVPIWRIPTNTFCPLSSYPKKSINNPHVMRQLFLEHADEKHPNSIHIYTDGSKAGEDVGCAAVCQDTTSFGKLLPETSVFSSELYAMKLALDIIEGTHGLSFTIFTDSMSALQAVRSCDCGHPLMAQILMKISRLHPKHVCICWVPGHVDVLGNEEADKQAKLAATSDGGCLNLGVPCRDLYPSIKGALMRSWQGKWTETTENKMREIKPTVRPWPSSSCRDRRMEVVLCRLRIGHTLLTHGYLMERGPPPYCMDCIVPLTVKHIIAECPNFLAERRAQFPRLQNQDPTQILRDILAELPDKRYDHRPLRQFLQNCDLLAKL